jgi:thiol-disulfide isomerase/thioredoxin
MRHFVIIVLSAACAPESPGAAAPSRVDAVAAPAKSAASPQSFCDVYATGETARRFDYPELDGAPPPGAGKWRWINVWATFCEPCIEEMPTLLDWRKRLAAAGTPLELVFLSVDESAATVESFARAHPNLPLGPRVKNAADPAALTAWLGSLGLDASAAIPIQIFVAPDDRIRCVRTGALSHYHYDAVAALLR